MTYEVQTLFYPDTWENAWINDGDEAPVQFDTYGAAAAELADHLRDLAYAVKHGHMEDFNPADYRIKKL
jgi:hypothetical protein